jgi:lipopolysaccharide export system protein LptC
VPADRLALAFPILVAALLAAVTFWLDNVVRTTPAGSTAGRHDPDFIVETFTATQTGADGLLRHVLRADRMTHYPDDDTTHLEKPRLTHYTEKRLTVHASSDRATLSTDGEQVQLSDNVRLTRAATPTQSELTLLTSTLLVTPNKGFARTDAPVIIEDARSRTDAVGLEFDYNKRRLTLLRDVRSTWQAPRSAAP